MFNLEFSQLYVTIVSSLTSSINISRIIACQKCTNVWQYTFHFYLFLCTRFKFWTTGLEFALYLSSLSTTVLHNEYSIARKLLTLTIFQQIFPSSPLISLIFDFHFSSLKLSGKGKSARAIKRLTGETVRSQLAAIRRRNEYFPVTRDIEMNEPPAELLCELISHVTNARV